MSERARMRAIGRPWEKLPAALHRGNRGSVPARAARGCDGFALVIALALMAFALLLMLSLSTFVRVETTLASQGERRLGARQNALLGLRVAMGELQRQMGPDQRVNAPAAQKLPTDATSEHRHWTGVYEGWQPNEPGGELRASPVFRRWLVSASDADGRTPAWIDEAETVGSPSFSARDALAEPVELVAGEEGDAVIAGKRATGIGEGRYAWWIGDENGKAFLRRASSGERSMDTWKRDRASAAVTAYPFIDGLGGLAPDSALLDRFVGRGDLAFAPEMESVDRGRAFHDVTPYARGVLSSARNGGLRRDLSFHLETARAERPMETFYEAPADREGAPDMAGIGFDGIWAFHNLWKDLSGDDERPVLRSDYARDRLSPKAYYKAPVILRTGWFVAVSAMKEGPGEDGEPRYQALLRFNPFVVLWNPYNAPLELSDDDILKLNVLGFPYEVNFYTADGPGAGALADFSYEWWMAFSDRGGAGFSRVQMNVKGEDTEAFAPGEVVVFSAGGDAGDTFDGGIRNTRNPDDEGARNRNFAVQLNARRGWNRSGGIIVRAETSFIAKSELFRGDDYLYLRIAHDKRWGAVAGKDMGRANSMFYTGFWSQISGGGAALNGAVVNAEHYPFGNDRSDRPPHRFADHPDKFPWIPPRDGGFAGDKIGVGVPVENMPGTWTDIGLLSFEMHAEDPLADWPETPALHLFNPGSGVTQVNSWEDEDLVANPYRFRTFALASPNDLDGVLDVESSGQSFFGAGYDSGIGQKHVVVRAIPEGPAKTLGDLQHAATLGRGRFGEDAARDHLRGHWRPGNYLGPTVARPIGNAYAPAVLPPDQVRGHSNPKSFRDGDPGTPAVDHSYLANQFLWDGWFFSTISPEPSDDFEVAREQEDVWDDFLSGEASLPNERFAPAPGASDRELFEGGEPVEHADRKSTANLMVEGAFNVNSVDPEVWAAQLAPLRGRAVPVRSPGGPGVSWADHADTEVPMPGLVTPIGGAVKSGDFDFSFPRHRPNGAATAY